MEGNIEIIGTDQKINTVDKSTLFTTHNMRFKFAIVNGEQPKSKYPFHMKNWTGYKFINDGYTVVSTTKSIIIYINQDLGAGTIDDLNLKYTEVAQAHANNFARQHNLTLGKLQRHGIPHYGKLLFNNSRRLVSRGR